MKDETMPAGPWTFDAAVTAAFDDMLRRSIPQHDDMRRLVAAIASRYLPDRGALVDLGCSRGEALATVRDYVGPDRRAHYVGVEASPTMAEAARARFADCADVTIWERDLRQWYPLVPGREQLDVTLAVLTLQFVPIEHRQRLVTVMRQRTRYAAVIVEKVLGDTAELDDVMVELYLELKRDHGYTHEQVERKRLSLEGVLVPVTAAWNVEMLRRAGFSQVDCFWRWGCFAGWVALP